MSCKTSNHLPQKSDEQDSQAYTNTLSYYNHPRYRPGTGKQQAEPESRPPILMDRKPNYRTTGMRLPDKQRGFGHIKEILKDGQKQVKPEQRRFRYTDDFDEFTEQAEGRKRRNSNYNHDQRLGKTSLLEMPDVAKQIYTRIPPKRTIQGAGRDFLKDQGLNTKVEGRSRGVHLGIERDTSTGRIAYEKPQREEYVRMNRTPKTHDVPLLSSQTGPFTSWKDQQLFKKEDIMIVEKVAQTGLHKRQQFERPLQSPIDYQKSHSKLKRVAYQADHFQKASSINISSQTPYLQYRKNTKQANQKRHLRYNSFQSTKTLSFNECKTTDHSNENYTDGLVSQKLLYRQDRPQHTRSREQSYVPSQETRFRHLGGNLDKENRPVNQQRSNVVFSRKLKQYEDDALRKIQTINELNTKIGERIKNILRNFEI